MRPGLLRQVFFWLHLVSGVVAAVVIAIMSATGVALVFESSVLGSVERAERTLASVPPDGADKLALAALVERVGREHPEVEFSNLTVFPEEGSAVLLGAGRRGGYWVDPYTGASWEAGTSAWVGVFSTLTNWHRWLGLEGEGRAVGRAVTGASNVAFLVLALTGLVLWWPRRWTKPVLKSTAWFRTGLNAKGRDFNWHNVIGFWTLPVIIVLVVSGMVISYGWASDLVYRIAGEAPQKGRGQSTPVLVASPAPASVPVTLEAAFASAAKAAPGFERLTLRLPTAPGGEGARAGGEGRERPAGARGEGGAPRKKDRAGVGALVFTARAADRTPVSANSQLSLDPFTGNVLKVDGPGQLSTGRKARTWLRFLHTGEALGVAGQAVAAVASLGALVMVWTGLALSWRRFFRRRGKKAALTASAGLEIPELANASEVRERAAA